MSCVPQSELYDRRVKLKYVSWHIDTFFMMVRIRDMVHFFVANCFALVVHSGVL